MKDDHGIFGSRGGRSSHSQLAGAAPVGRATLCTPLKTVSPFANRSLRLPRRTAPSGENDHRCGRSNGPEWRLQFPVGERIGSIHGVLTGLHPMGLASPSQLLHLTFPRKSVILPDATGKRTDTEYGLLSHVFRRCQARGPAMAGRISSCVLMGYHPFRCTLCPSLSLASPYLSADFHL